jgi:hypothetical protein
MKCGDQGALSFCGTLTHSMFNVGAGSSIALGFQFYCRWDNGFGFSSEIRGMFVDYCSIMLWFELGLSFGLETSSSSLP